MTGSLPVANRAAPKSRTAWRLLILMLAIATWLACFVALDRCGTWTIFAFAGGTLAALACGLDPALPSLLRPSGSKLVVGLVIGALMVVLTHAVFAPLAVFQPGIRAATLKLYDLLNMVGLSPLVRAALVVVIATSEEVLFRGVLADSGLDGLENWHRRLASWPRLSRVAALAACYAAATLTLGNPLLVACAFLCGVAWGGLRVATRSLVPSVVAHIAWDLGVLLIWPLA